MRNTRRRFSGSLPLQVPSCACIALAASTALTALANSARTLSPGMSTTRPPWRAMTPVTSSRQAASVRTVPISSSLISRL